MDEPILIKRYANRKLYDQRQSRYVTLEDLADLIRQGRQIRVVDAASGEDLTSLTLAQIILEAQRDRTVSLPAAFLHQIVKHGAAWQEFAQQSLEASLAGVVETQREAERVMRSWAARAGWGGDAPTPGPARAGAASPGRGGKPGTSEGRADEGELRAELDALKAKLSDLESRIGRGKSPSRSRRDAEGVGR
jgi:polyhydroxyalkanoate synthesis repressor PhaR